MPRDVGDGPVVADGLDHGSNLLAARCLPVFGEVLRGEWHRFLDVDLRRTMRSSGVIVLMARASDDPEAW
jgi:hypothetical protein